MDFRDHSLGQLVADVQAGRRSAEQLAEETLASIVALDEARSGFVALREAQAVLAEFERKQKEVEEQAAQIVAQAKPDAEEAAESAKAELERSIARRIQSAEDQIASAEAGAVKQVRDRAIEVAVDAARVVVAGQIAA